VKEQAFCHIYSEVYLLFFYKKDASCLDPHTKDTINTNSGAVTQFPASPHGSKWRQPAGKSPV